MIRVAFIVGALIVFAAANPASAGVDILTQPFAKVRLAKSDRADPSAWESFRRCHWMWPARTRLWCTRPNSRG